MKIILAPSKTKNGKILAKECQFNKDKTTEIVEAIKDLTVEEIEKIFKVKLEKAKEILDFYNSFDNNQSFEAISSYDGLVFKRFSYGTLDDKAKTFAKDHICFLSALYGVILPSEGIKQYRLDLVNNIFKGKKLNLTKFWEQDVVNYFKDEDFIINLASKEYGKLLKHKKMFIFEFWEEKNGKLKNCATRNKEMRGTFARFLVENNITDIKNIPQEINGYKLITNDFENEENIITIKYLKKEA